MVELLIVAVLELLVKVIMVEVLAVILVHHIHAEAGVVLAL
jgi:hypothetical protein